MIRKKLNDAHRSFSYSAPEVSLVGDWPQFQKEDSQLLKAWDQMNQRLFYRNPYLFTFLLLLLILLFRGGAKNAETATKRDTKRRSP